MPIDILAGLVAIGAILATNGIQRHLDDRKHGHLNVQVLTDLDVDCVVMAADEANDDFGQQHRAEN
ncbi:hypothetical protein LTR65_006214 [Meristemomyces frigidus]